MLRYPPFEKLEESVQDDMIEKIERSCLNVSIKKCREGNATRSWSNPTFALMYSTTIVDVVEAMNWDHNQYLIPKILDGQIAPETVGFLSQDQLCPRKDLEMRVEERKNVVIVLKTTSLWKCPNCGTKKALHQDVQLRGSDENKDTQLKCCFCDHEWVEKN